MGWKRAWAEPAERKIYNAFEVKVEIDSLNEFTKDQTYQTLMGLAQAGAPVGDMLIRNAPLNSADKLELEANQRRQAQVQAQMMQAAQAQAGAGPGMPPGVPGQLALPAGVSVIERGTMGGG
jgi:hypothetical protein